MTKEPTTATLSTQGLRALADALDAQHKASASCEATVTTGAVAFIDDQNGEIQTVAFRCSDDPSDLPRVCLFSDNTTSPDF